MIHSITSSVTLPMAEHEILCTVYRSSNPHYNSLQPKQTELYVLLLRPHRSALYQPHFSVLTDQHATCLAYNTQNLFIQPHSTEGNKASGMDNLSPTPYNYQRSHSQISQQMIKNTVFCQNNRSKTKRAHNNFNTACTVPRN